MSRLPGSEGHDPFRLSPRTPGPLGYQDAADCNVSHLLGDTAGPLGINDWGDPDANSRCGFGIFEMHSTISRDKDLFLWDYDPKHLLDNKRLNPEFVKLAHRALKSAVHLGLRPKVHEAYRSPQESDRKHALSERKAGGRAASSWRSAHNYGLAMDVWLYDRRNRLVETPAKGWYASYKHLAGACSRFLWGAPFNDADHFEYHPNWLKPARGELLIAVRDWAMRAALASNQLVKWDARASEPLPGVSSAQKDFIPESDIDWLPYFWWAAGAKEGKAPSDKYMASNRTPTQA